jgi:hypothetical protein
MTITINRNLLLFVVALIALGVVGYFIGTSIMSPSPGGTADVAPAQVTATLPPELAAAGDQVLSQPSPVPDTAPRIEVEEFKQEFDAREDVMVVDVRVPEAYAAGHIAGAVSIPEAEIANRQAELPKDKHIVLYCA